MLLETLSTASKRRKHVRLRVPSRCVGIAAIATVAHRLASTPQSTHHRTTLSHPEKCHAKCGKALWASKMATALPSLPFVPLQAFFPGQTSDFWAFFVLQLCNCQGQVATCSPSAGQFELSALSRARAQSLGHSGHTMRTADPNKCETS